MAHLKQHLMCRPQETKKDQTHGVELREQIIGGIIREEEATEGVTEAMTGEDTGAEEVVEDTTKRLM